MDTCFVSFVIAKYMCYVTPDKVILFMSDGKPTDYGDKGKEIISTIRERNADVNDTVIILTYGIGAGK